MDFIELLSVIWVITSEHLLCAIVFSRAGQIRYIAKREEFSRTSVWNKEPLPREALKAPWEVSDIEEVDPEDWLLDGEKHCLSMQTLGQDGGFQMTLLIAEDVGDDGS